MVHLNYKTYGHSGHPIFILHGLLGMLDNWQTQSKKFAAAGFNVFALDLRNHGKSPHSNAFDYEVMAGDVHDFMKHHHVSSAHLLGHSMGGKVAMQFALTFPQRVDKLVVVDVAPRQYLSAHDEILDAMCSLKLKEFRTRHEADHEIAQRIPDYHLRQFILKNLMRTETGEFKWKINLSIIQRHYPDIAGDITATGTFEKHTLFVKGGRSKYISEGDKPRIKELFPRSRIATIKEAGHWVHADKPDEFGRIVVKFLM